MRREHRCYPLCEHDPERTRWWNRASRYLTRAGIEPDPEDHYGLWWRGWCEDLGDKIRRQEPDPLPFFRMAPVTASEIRERLRHEEWLCALESSRRAPKREYDPMGHGGDDIPF